MASYIINDPDLAVCCDQALSQKEAEKAALTEKLAGLQQDLATAGMEKEHTRREALSKQEKDKVRSYWLWSLFLFCMYHPAD